MMFRSQPAVAKTVLKSSVPEPELAGTACDATAPVSVSISWVALRKELDTQPIVKEPLSTPPSYSLPSK